MRAALDTNILISALLVNSGHPATIYKAWQQGEFTLLICEEQIFELRSVLRKPAIVARIKAHRTGRLINQLKDIGEMIRSILRLTLSPDPTDDFLLALSQEGKADYLVTGDKSAFLCLRRHGVTRIVTAHQFTEQLGSAF